MVIDRPRFAESDLWWQRIKVCTYSPPCGLPPFYRQQIENLMKSSKLHETGFRVRSFGFNCSDIHLIYMINLVRTNRLSPSLFASLEHICFKITFCHIAKMPSRTTYSTCTTNPLIIFQPSIQKPLVSPASISGLVNNKELISCQLTCLPSESKAQPESL